jgi:3-oxoacyl-[acyl-carrier protein] reductase
VDLGLRGKVALVAASSRGLGRAVAEELASEGASLVLCARDGDALATCAGEIESKWSVPVLAVPADVGVRGGPEGVVGAGIERFGRVDILVTNSGGPPSGPFDSLTLEQWDDAARLLLSSAVEFARVVLPGMKERGWGRILAVTSIAAKQPVPSLVLSNSLRAAVTGLTRTLADEVARNGVTVNTILPGYTETERVVELNEATARREGIEPAEARARIEAEIPMGRLGEPREFAAMAAFLVSERASYVTGQSIAVDGGWIKALL